MNFNADKSTYSKSKNEETVNDHCVSELHGDKRDEFVTIY